MCRNSLWHALVNYECKHGQPYKLKVLLGHATSLDHGVSDYGLDREDSFSGKGPPLAHLLWYGLSR